MTTTKLLLVLLAVVIPFYLCLVEVIKREKKEIVDLIREESSKTRKITIECSDIIIRESAKK